MGLTRLFTIDIYLVICIIAAWLIELVLGTPKFARGASPPAARFVKASADMAFSYIKRKKTRRDGGKERAVQVEKRAGAFLLAYLVLFSFIVTAVLLDFARKLHPLLYYIFNTLIF